MSDAQNTILDRRLVRTQNQVRLTAIKERIASHLYTKLLSQARMPECAKHILGDNIIQFYNIAVTVDMFEYDEDVATYRAHSEDCNAILRRRLKYRDLTGMTIEWCRSNDMICAIGFYGVV